jgi:hypothetical protein
MTTMETAANTFREVPNPAIPGFRKTARVLSGIIAVFLVLVGIGEVLEGLQRAGPPPTPMAILGISLTVAYCMGLALSLKWERIGALVALASIAGIYVLLAVGAFPGGPGGSRGAMLNPFMLFFWIPVLLYATCWALVRWGRVRTSAG